MSIGLTKSRTHDLDELSRTHAELVAELDQAALAFGADGGVHANFIARVDSFLAELKACVPEADSTEAFETINRMAAEWQLKFTTVLRIPRNIFDELEIRRIPDTREPTLQRPIPTTNDDVLRLVKHRAFEISTRWKLEWVTWLLHELEHHPEVIHQGTLTPPSRLPEDDWNEACALLACDVLDGRIDLALQMSHPGLEFLGNIWLEDVKRAKAYLSWKGAVAAAQPRDHVFHYFEACHEIHSRVMDGKLKASPTSFAPIAAWIEQEFLNQDGTLCLGKQRTQDLIRRKAHRLWERAADSDSLENWRQAEEYVRDFYENVVPAVMDRNDQAVQRALKAMAACTSPGHSREITSALEVALVAYFFEPAQMAEFFNKTQPCYV